MFEGLGRLAPVLQALIATLFTWGVTALGAGLVFFFKTINKRVLNAMLGFASGVMIAASFWSLLEPALEMAQGGATPAWLVAATGFLGGGLFLFLVDKLLPFALSFAAGAMIYVVVEELIPEARRTVPPTSPSSATWSASRS